MNITVSVPQIGDDDTVGEIDAFLAGLAGRVEVLGILDDTALTLRVGGYRVEGQKPLVREHDWDNPGNDFRRTHYNSMTLVFEREDEAREFHERFG